MNADPAASMRCWAVDVELGGEVYTIPPLPAADWWPVLADGSVAAMLDLFPAGTDLDDRLISDPIIAGEMESAFRDAIETACGRTAEEAVVIAQVAIPNWAWANGKLTLAGFRWDTMPIAAALDALHALFLEYLTEEGRKEYESALKKAAPARLDRRRALSEFEAGAGPRPAPARSSAAPSGDSPTRTRQPSQPPRRRAPSAAPTPPPG